MAALRSAPRALHRGCAADISRGSLRLFRAAVRRWRAVTPGWPLDGAVVTAFDPGLDAPGVESRDVVLVTGPWLAGSTSVIAALRERMPEKTFVETDDLGPADAPAAVVFVVSAIAPLTESDCAIVDVAVEHTDLVIGVVSKTDVHRNWRGVLFADRACWRRTPPATTTCPGWVLRRRLIWVSRLPSSKRSSGYTMLVHLPDGYKPEQVAPALAAKIQTLPEVVRRSLTWDQGPEMCDWKQAAIAADIEIFFCDPHKPWQRGSNENTNGLLRQYFPKGSDLSVHSAAELDQVAAELNDRPRKRLGYRKPIEEIGHLFAA